MLYLKAKNSGVAFEFFDLIADVIRIVRKTLAEVYHQLVRPIIYSSNAPEYYHASDIERPMSVLVMALVGDAE